MSITNDPYGDAISAIENAKEHASATREACKDAERKVNALRDRYQQCLDVISEQKELLERGLLTAKNRVAYLESLIFDFHKTTTSLISKHDPLEPEMQCNPQVAAQLEAALAEPAPY